MVAQEGRRYQPPAKSRATSYGAVSIPDGSRAEGGLFRKANAWTNRKLLKVISLTSVLAVVIYALISSTAESQLRKGSLARTIDSVSVQKQLLDELSDCQCIGSCDTTTPEGLYYCVIGDNPQCKGVYGDVAVDSIDGTTNADGLFEAFCGVIYGDYDCASQPCLNGGYCIDGQNTYTCVCPHGITGVNCEGDINECAFLAEQPCAAHAGCTNTFGSFECHCLSGFQGDPYDIEDEGDLSKGFASKWKNTDTGDEPARPPQVEVHGCQDIDDCAASPCANGATCEDNGAMSHHCDCADGFIGVSCTVDVDECFDGTDICDEDATCFNSQGTYSCQCNSGFAGDGLIGTYVADGADETLTDYLGCSDVDDCVNSPCINGGSCNDAGTDAFMCYCDDGWDGIVCNQDLNECREQTHECANAAECFNSLGSYTCSCDSGFSGDGVVCEDADDCANFPCQNGASCIDTGTNAFTCSCGDGWMGMHCEEDKDECSSGRHVCHSHAVCSNLAGNYTCACDAGFSGDGMEACEDIDDCASFPCEHGVCADLGANSYDCECETGWKDTNCDMDINECADGTHECSPDATCANSDGGYECSCHAGFTGTGASCSDIDDCEQEGLCIHGTCMDAGVQTYMCECAPGYTDTNCDFDIDECSEGVHHCHTHAGCVNTPGSYACECNSGWEGDGTATCADINDCEATPCVHGNCVDGGQSKYECVCHEGWKDTNCDYDLNECAQQTHRCAEAGRCLNTPGSYSCRCQSGWEGDGFTCKDVDDCTPDPCVFGTCTDTGPNAFHCSCMDGWTSGSCDQDIDECIDSTHACDMRAACTNTQGGHECACDPEFYGDGMSCYPCTVCEAGMAQDSACGASDRTCKDINECATSTHNCAQRAQCENMAGAFTCICQESFYGDGVSCEPCEECSAGYHVAEECATDHNARCEINVVDGLFTLESEADGSRKCLIFSANGENQYPERYNWGASEQLCGIHTMGTLSQTKALLSNRQAVFRLTQLQGDLYTIESNADGGGWKCIRFGMNGHNQYPDRHNWIDGVKHQPNCGFPSQEGAGVAESLIADGQAVFRLVPLRGDKYLIQSNAAHDGYQCVIFGGHGYDTNPRRFNWGNGDEYCGAGHWNGLSLLDAVLDNKQAVWTLTRIASCPDETC